MWSSHDPGGGGDAVALALGLSLVLDALLVVGEYDPINHRSMS